MDLFFKSIRCLIHFQNQALRFTKHIHYQLILYDTRGYHGFQVIFRILFLFERFNPDRSGAKGNLLTG
jgi:hypothetical protein